MTRFDRRDMLLGKEESMNRLAAADELVKIAKELLALGPRNVGLPGGRGMKEHYWFMVGNAAASRGKPSAPPAFLSKACAAAYQKGYDLGLKQKGQTP